MCPSPTQQSTHLSFSYIRHICRMNLVRHMTSFSGPPTEMIKLGDNISWVLTYLCHLEFIVSIGSLDL